MLTRCSKFASRFTAELTQRRYLFSAQRLGIQGYVDARNRIECPNEKHGYLYNRISLLLSEDHDIPSELLLYYLHVSNKTPDSLKLLKDAVFRYANRDEYLRFSSPRVGTTLMRFLYRYNLMDLALELYEREDLTVFFNDTINVTILMNGLYVNGLFDDVIRVYELFSRRFPEQQFDLKLNEDNQYFSPNCLLLFLTACYRLNTDESCDKAAARFHLLEQTINKDSINRRTVSVFLMLLMNRGRLEEAMKLVTSRSDPMVGVLRDIKILLYAKLGDLQKAVSMLRTAFDDSLQPTSINFVYRHSPDMLEELETLVKAKMDTDTTRMYEEVVKALGAFNRIGNARIDDILTAPLHRRGDMNDDGSRRNLSSKQTQRFEFEQPPRGGHYFPGLRDLN